MGRQPPSATLTLAEHGTLWIIRLHRAVFNCTVIVYLYSSLYSCAHYFSASTCRETQGFWLLHGSPHATTCTIPTEQGALGLVWRGEIVSLLPSLSYGMWACAGKRGRSWHLCEHVCVCSCVTVCLCLWVCSLV